jgi:hypothetical protein
MAIERYRCNRNELLDALAGHEHIMAWMAQAEEEPAGLVDRPLLEHLGRCKRTAQQLLTAGLEFLMAQDQEATDLLLTDCFACGTWSGWALPVEKLESIEDEEAPEDCPRGLLGTDQVGSGATIWQVADNEVWLSRNRKAPSEADQQHWQGMR